MKCKFVDSEIPFYHFTDDGFSCKIVPSFGGSIQEYILDGTQIIKGVSIDKDGFEEYKEFCNSAILFPFPNRVANGAFTFGDTQYQLDLNEPKYGNAIHGFVFTECPEVISQDDNSIVLRYGHNKSPGYPFPYILDVKYSVSKQVIGLQFKVSNTGDKLMPFGIGWHPYFYTENQKEFTLEFEADKKYLVNERMIPDHSVPVNKATFEVSDLEVDNAYRLKSKQILLKGSDYKLKISVPEESYLQLYNPNDKQSFAIEPMSCIPDAFNNKIGLKTLRPDQEYSWSVKLEVSVHSS